MRSKYLVVATVAVAVAGIASFSTAAPLGTAFTYQGQLLDGGLPANDEYDMRFSLFGVETGGTAVAGPIVFDGAGANPPPIDVIDGLFVVEIDFGGVFDGTALWLQIELQPHGTVGYTILTPRQALTAAPYALALPNVYPNATTGNVGIGTPAPASDLDVADPDGQAFFTLTTGVHPSGSVIELRNNAASATVLGGVRFLNAAGQFPGRVEYRADDELVFYTDFGQRMRIDAAGNVGISIGTPEAKLHVDGGSDTAPAGGGYIVAGSTTSTNISIDNNEIMARNNGAVARLTLNANGGVVDIGDVEIEGSSINSTDGGAFPTLSINDTSNDNVTLCTGGGNVGIGTPLPLVKLHVDGGTDTAVSGGGYIVAGSSTSTNVSIDNNEIMARDNGAVATLTLNNNGGDVKIGGALDIGYEIIVTSPATNPTAICSSGKKVLGGGCFVNALDERIKSSYPSAGGAGWTCYASGEPVQAHAICARVK